MIEEEDKTAKREPRMMQKRKGENGGQKEQLSRIERSRGGE